MTATMTVVPGPPLLVKGARAHSARQRVSRAFSRSFPWFPVAGAPSREAKRSEMKREAKRIEAK